MGYLDNRQPPGTPRTEDAWSEGGAYETYVGRWSRLVAREVLRRPAFPSGLRWIDVGCGTGALSRTVLDIAAPAAVVGIDRSAGYASYARRQISDPRARFAVGDAMSLPVKSDEFDAAVSGLVLNFVPDPAAMISEMARVVRPRGIVTAYVWDYSGDMQMMRYFWNAAVDLNPVARDLDEGRRFPICRPRPLAELFRFVGLAGIEIRAIDVPTDFRGFDDFWSPFLGGQGPAPGYLLNLSEGGRQALRDLVRQRLPISEDGSIHLIARAWAVHGTRPPA